MKKKFYYLASLFTVFVVPVIVIGFFVWPHISLLHLIIFVVLITILGSMWDIWASRHGNRDPVWLWQFNHKETLGIAIFDLPIEEYLFYIASSLYVIFIWEAIELALVQENSALWLLVPGAGVWTLIVVFLHYRMGKN